MLYISKVYMYLSGMENATTTFKEYNDKELNEKLDSLMNEEESTIEEDIKELHKLEQKGKNIVWKINGEINPEFRNHSNALVELKKTFQSKWGDKCLTTFVIYTTLKTRLQNVPNNLNKSTFKLQNSKGNGYGNL